VEASFFHELMSFYSPTYVLPAHNISRVHMAAHVTVHVLHVPVDIDSRDIVDPSMALECTVPHRDISQVNVSLNVASPLIVYIRPIDSSAAYSLVRDSRETRRRTKEWNMTAKESRMDQERKKGHHFHVCYASK